MHIQMNNQLCALVSHQHWTRYISMFQTTVLLCNAIGIPAHIYIQLRVRACLVSACACLLTGPHLHSPVRGACALPSLLIPNHLISPLPALWDLSAPTRSPLDLLLISLDQCVLWCRGSLLFEASCRCVLFTCESLSLFHCRVSIKPCWTPAYRVYLCTDFALGWCTVERRIMCNASGNSLAKSTVCLQ
jgi:hypothetical protein